MQASLLRVFLDVSREFQDVRLASDEMIEVFALPERSGAAEQMIGVMRRIRFPGMKDVCQTMRLTRRKQGVHMVGHHAPCEKIVPLAVKLPEGVRDNLRDARITHVAFAKGIVKEALGSLDQSAKLAGSVQVGGNGSLRVGGACDGFALQAKKLDQFARERVGKAEGDEINGMVTFPMGEIAARAN